MGSRWDGCLGVAGCEANDPGGGGGKHTLILSHGQGSRLWDIEGNSYLDAQGGAWLNKVGYGRTELAEVAAKQMEKMPTFSIGFDYANTPSIEFAEFQEPSSELTL